MTTFSDLNLAGKILRAIEETGYTEPTPIQAQTIPALLDGRDLLGIAQTGTGKTAAFSLPLLQAMLSNHGKAQSGLPRALVLAPTRELAGQIAENLQTYGKHAYLRILTVFGGASIRNQIRKLEKGVHVLVATPGRLIDLMNQGCVSLEAVECLVLDEADRMLDMGFARDLRKIMDRLPTERQTALFSATMPKAVEGLAEALLSDPVRVEVAPQATTAEKVDQRVMFVPREKKRALLSRLLRDETISRALVFTRTKRGADRVAKQLDQEGIQADAIHGNKAQNARQRALNAFRDGETRILVATDIAARGIDVDGVTHVINFELPNEPDSYVHRIGRTARAGASGQAISFCDHEELAYLRDIEKTIAQPVPVDADHQFHVDLSNVVAAKPSKGRPKRNAGKNAEKSSAKPTGPRRRKKNRANRQANRAA